MGRAPCCEKVGLKRGRWTAEEDDILNKYIQANGQGSWRSLPKNAGLLRCGKSCRLRWVNYLRADIKRGNFTAQEEDLIINLHATLGNRWSLIASHLSGRTDNEIKNFWNSHLSRKIHSFRRPFTQTMAVIMDVNKAVIAKRKGGRGSSIKKNKTQKDADQIPANKPMEKDTLSITGIEDKEITLGSNEERESLVSEGGTKENSMLYPSGNVEKETGILDPLESIESRGITWVNDIMDSDFVQSDGDLMSFSMAAINEEIVSGNSSGESGDLNSSSSITCCFVDDDLEWDRVLHGNELWDEEENMCSWLWEESSEYNRNKLDYDHNNDSIMSDDAWIFS